MPVDVTISDHAYNYTIFFLHDIQEHVCHSFKTTLAINLYNDLYFVLLVGLIQWHTVYLVSVRFLESSLMNTESTP